MDTTRKTTFEALKSRLKANEEAVLTEFATSSAQAQRRVPDARLEDGYRQPFAADVDRIVNSLAYTRYIDKTQVFSLIQNDHITHRILHVQLVARIARVIGKMLGLNEDLIEAIALGHDIGHPPFGHDGEKYLSELCVRHGIGQFHHNAQGVRFLDRIERNGNGWNLCLQTLDGILCHNGEHHEYAIEPDTNKTFDTLAAETAGVVSGTPQQLAPMTLEGCVVKMADTISYIGRDIEDAIRLNIIRRSRLPEECTRVLGNTNGTIVHTLVTDITESSFGKNRIGYSHDIFEAVEALKRFNCEAIYRNPKAKKHLGNVRNLFTILFERCMDDLRKENTESAVVSGFLANLSPEYRHANKPAEIVRDFIAGMTDNFFMRQFSEKERKKLEFYAGKS